MKSNFAHAMVGSQFAPREPRGLANLNLARAMFAQGCSTAEMCAAFRGFGAPAVEFVPQPYIGHGPRYNVRREVIR